MSKESEKIAARKTLKGNLRSLKASEVLVKSASIAEVLLTLLCELREKKLDEAKPTLGVYSPLEAEANWLCIEDQLRKSWELVYPSFCEERGIRYRSGKLGLLKSKEFGVEILSPPRDAFEMTPDVCLVPGLGFSRLGERLGRGKGFYDRFLSRFEGIKIGLSFNEQIMEEIPVEAHDVLLDFLVGEETIYQQGKPYKFWSQTKDT